MTTTSLPRPHTSHNRHPRPSHTSTPHDPHRQSRRYPPPPPTVRACTTAGEARGLLEAYPKSRTQSPSNPPPQDPKGSASATPCHMHHGAARATGGLLPDGPPPPPRTQGAAPVLPLLATCATARRGRPGMPTQKAAPSPESEPTSPEIGRGSKRDLSHPPRSL
jgi:hypothetical protein